MKTGKEKKNPLVWSYTNLVGTQHERRERGVDALICGGWPGNWRSTRA